MTCQRSIAVFLFPVLNLLSCGQEPEKELKTLEVSASAYNSIAYQTQGDPLITAYGDTLKPGMKAIAVSRDLIDSGLVHNTKVYIHELNDTFLVVDKMHGRWLRKIDIYMGQNLDSAREWGLQKVKISWEVPADTSG